MKSYLVFYHVDGGRLFSVRNTKANKELWNAILFLSLLQKNTNGTEYYVVFGVKDKTKYQFESQKRKLD